MTIQEAFSQFIQTKNYKAKSNIQDKNGQRYRQTKSRFLRGKAKLDTLISILIENDYKVEVSQIKKNTRLLVDSTLRIQK